MDRIAVLIEASQVLGQKPCPGASVDVNTFEDYLNLNVGGAWNKDTEIVKYRNPTRDTILQVIKDIGRYDYAFITFSGHGGHPSGGAMEDTELCLQDYTEAKVYELIPRCHRSTIVVDACRKLPAITITTNLMEMRKKAIARFAEKRATRQDYVDRFNRLVEDCDKGSIKLYSCDIDESANEDTRRGGLFSRSLVERATREDDQDIDGPMCLRMDTAFAWAANETTRREPAQNPQYQPGRRQQHFPFGLYLP